MPSKLNPDFRLYLKLTPELTQLDPDRAARVIASSNKAMMRSARFNTFMVLFFMGTCAGVAFLMRFVVPLVRGQSTWITVALCAGFIALVTFAFIAIQRLLFARRLSEAVRRAMREEGCAICIACGYDLFANESGRCPECGADAPRDGDGTRVRGDAASSRANDQNA